jgi:hypothetical protein
MSASNEYATYYLTDNGWLHVSTKWDGCHEEEYSSIPEKYYMICIYKECLGDVQGAWYKGISEKFKDDAQKDKIKELIAKFGNCPLSLYR